MRTYFAGVLFSAVATCGVAASSAEYHQCDRVGTQLAVKISAENLIIKNKKSASLKITIENVSSEPVSLEPFMAVEDYWLRFEVIGPDEKISPWSGPEKNFRDDGERFTLYPGYYWGRSIHNVAMHYEFARSGVYSVRAIYGIGWDGKCPYGKYYSNVVKLVKSSSSSEPLVPE